LIDSVAEQLNSFQNGKNISRKDAKLAKKGQVILILNQDVEFFFAFFAFFAALRETPLVQLF